MFDLLFLTFPFMTAVLGSVIFWIAYGLVSFVMGIACMRITAPETHRGILGGYKPRYLEWFEVVFIILANFIGWPLIILGVIIQFICKLIYKIVFCKMIGPGFQFLYKATDKAIPDVKIDIDD